MMPGAAYDATDQQSERVRDAFEAVSDRLLGYLTGLTRGQRHLAEDLLQETFLRTWCRAGDLPVDPAQARPWLFTVARRAAIDELRSRRRRPVQIPLTDGDNGEAVADIADRVVDTFVLRNALAGLSSPHQQVIIEVFFRQRATIEIAQDLGIPEGTVKSRTHYAMRSLAAALGHGK